MVFDTGQAVLGWVAAFQASTDDKYWTAALRAADWLIAVQDESGAWKRNQHLGVVKVIDTRVAWALLRIWEYSGDSRHRASATMNLEWALRQQQKDGWFTSAALVEDEDATTHTIAYTAQGLLESGRVLKASRYVFAAQQVADALLSAQRSDGSLPSSFGIGWRVTDRSSCLTGNSQIAHLWLKLYQMLGDEQYFEAAIKAVSFVASTQNLDTSNPNIRGGIAGSHPIYGRYERLKYPNWAAKFFADAMIALDEIERGTFHSGYVG